MRLGAREATVKIDFSYLVPVKIQETKAESQSSGSSPAAAISDAAVSLLDGKLKIDIPPDFSRDPDNPKEPKTMAKFSGPEERGAKSCVHSWAHARRSTRLS